MEHAGFQYTPQKGVFNVLHVLSRDIANRDLEYLCEMIGHPFHIAFKRLWSLAEDLQTSVTWMAAHVT